LAFAAEGVDGGGDPGLTWRPTRSRRALLRAHRPRLRGDGRRADEGGGWPGM